MAISRITFLKKCANLEAVVFIILNIIYLDCRVNIISTTFWLIYFYDNCSYTWDIDITLVLLQKGILHFFLSDNYLDC